MNRLHSSPGIHPVALAAVLVLAGTAAGLDFANASTPAAASKEAPFVNSLGMKFVPVAGTKVLFSVWETRVQDYEALAKETKLEWKKPAFEQGAMHHAVNVSWDDAQSFCAWLSKKDGVKYRLPTDEEWSAAVGLRGEVGATPRDKDQKMEGYPWGVQWPLPKGSGNCHQSLKADSFEKTAPVGNFAANDFGIQDLGGNVLEWCEDWYDGNNLRRVLRGGSFVSGDGERSPLLSSFRLNEKPTLRTSSNVGFRVVVAGSSSAR